MYCIANMLFCVIKRYTLVSFCNAEELKQLKLYWLQVLLFFIAPSLSKKKRCSVRQNNIEQSKY